MPSSFDPCRNATNGNAWSPWIKTNCWEGDVLAADDLSSRPDFGPWLACMFVTPSARGTGIAEQLIEAWGKEQWIMSRALR